MKTPPVPESPLADPAIAFPAASRVLRRQGVGDGCNGRLPGSEAAADRVLGASEAPRKEHAPLENDVPFRRAFRAEM